MSAEPTIEAKGLIRRHGDRIAVDPIDFSVSHGNRSRRCRRFPTAPI